jgi:hypothetical protein
VDVWIEHIVWMFVMVHVCLSKSLVSIEYCWLSLDFKQASSCIRIELH